MWFEAELRSSLLHAAGVAAVVCGALFLADVALTVLARAGHATRAVASLRRVSPPLVRHTAEIAVTALLALGAARPAAASPTPVRDWLRQSTSTTTTTTTTPPATTATTTATTAASIPPATTPTTRPRARVPSPPTPVTAPATTTMPPAVTHATVTTERYVVAPGDCLWRIAARRLGPGATNQAIDGAWRAIYAANRAAVGDDPNLIHPGLVLALPPLAAAH